MDRGKLVKIRLLYMGIITALVAVALFESAREALPYWELVLATGFLVSWMLGQRFERLVIIEAGLADRADITEVERQVTTILPWSSSER